MKISNGETYGGLGNPLLLRFLRAGLFWTADPLFLVPIASNKGLEVRLRGSRGFI